MQKFVTADSIHVLIKDGEGYTMKLLEELDETYEEAELEEFDMSSDEFYEIVREELKKVALSTIRTSAFQEEIKDWLIAGGDIIIDFDTLDAHDKFEVISGYYNINSLLKIRWTFDTEDLACSIFEEKRLEIVDRIFETLLAEGSKIELERMNEEIGHTDLNGLSIRNITEIDDELFQTVIEYTPIAIRDSVMRKHLNIDWVIDEIENCLVC